MTLDLATLWAYIDKGGLLAFILLAVVAFVRGWIVPRYVYDREVTLREFFQGQVIRSTDLAEMATEVAKKKVDNRE